MYGRGELPGPTGTVPINPVSTTAYCTDPHDNSFSNGQIPLPPGFVPHQVPAMMAFPPGYVQRQIPTIMPVPQRPPGCPPGLEYLTQLEVQVPPGTAIGYVMQDWHPYLPKFTIRDERKRAVLRIVGPFCDCNCCSDVVFKVTSLDEALVIGRISKQWAGLDTEMFTDADHFGVQFPMDLDVKIKAVVLAACFLIDFMFFEHSPNQD
ncbi:phospholipid scramblase 1 isoform X3 [Ictalurus punctatus]|uniref:Phospholipid scramblase n=1 Tax=Ictalurus punctatus TaxID=7998 RepID=A0A9F7R339_ICTPU|nr:phospholipid scramblase 1 isoform X3 [Ictalurus punctatus]